MALSDAAIATVNTFPESLQVEFLCIAAVESDYVDNARGDYGLTGRPQSSDGYTSWGLWQINSVHGDILTSLTGSSSPDDWEQWLFDPNNNAQAAIAVYNQALQDYGNGFQPWSADTGKWEQYEQQATDAIAVANQQGSGSGNGNTPPGGTVSMPSAWWWIAGGALLAAGLVIGWQVIKNSKFSVSYSYGHGFAHREREKSRKDHRVNPKWLFYTKPTEATIDEVSEPASACRVLANLKKGIELRGTRLVEGRNIEPKVEAYFTANDGQGHRSIFISSAITEGARRCQSYPVQVYFHEESHDLEHGPECQPSIYGVQYSSEGHVVEEEQAELTSFAAMVQSGLPVEDYRGNVIPPGKVQIDYNLLRAYYPKGMVDTVEWGADVLVKAGQGDYGPITTQHCPALSGKGV